MDGIKHSRQFAEMERLVSDYFHCHLAPVMSKTQAYLTKKDYAKVIELGEAAAAAQPDETEKSDVYFILGAAYNAKEMKPQAIEALKKVTAGDNVAAAQKSVAELSK